VTALPELAIVIPTLGRAPAIHSVLHALGAQRPPLEAVEVLVVIGAEGPGEQIGQLDTAAHPFPLTVLKAEHAGVSAKRNAGWRATTARLVLFLDDDIVPQTQLVSEHLAWHRSYPEPEVGVLGNVRWSPRVKVTPFMRWLEMGIQFDYGTIAGIEAGWGRFYTCNVSVKRAMLEQVDGFDEQGFPFGYEDLDLARRMADQGFRLLYNERAVGEHLKTETLDGWRRNLRRNAFGEYRFVQQYPEVRPYFYERFRAAADAPTANGRSARLARFVAPEVPWLGPFVWHSFDLVCAQRLAPEFLAQWDAAEAQNG
jgi:glycosyltransferase involved in cell wall biosynthesis